MSEEKKVEQDERVAFEAAWSKVYDTGDFLLRHYSITEQYVNHDTQRAWEGWKLRAASTSANGDRFDPYRLKVAEECCERLMSACTDAGCPDGVRMDDWIRENIRSTSTNVAQGAGTIYQVRDDLRVWLDVDADGYERAQQEDRRIVYAAPPAQTALTGSWVDEMVSIAHEWSIATYYKGMGKPYRDIDEIRARLRAALTAAQSGGEPK